jgi:hypothetical protein
MAAKWHLSNKGNGDAKGFELFWRDKKSVKYH